MTTTAISRKIPKIKTCDFVTILKLSYRTTRCATMAKYVTERDHRSSSFGEFVFAMLSKVNKICFAWCSKEPSVHVQHD